MLILKLQFMRTITQYYGYGIQTVLFNQKRVQFSKFHMEHPFLAHSPIQSNVGVIDQKEGVVFKFFACAPVTEPLNHSTKCCTLSKHTGSSLKFYFMTHECFCSLISCLQLAIMVPCTVIFHCIHNISMPCILSSNIEIAKLELTVTTQHWYLVSAFKDSPCIFCMHLTNSKLVTN